MDIISHDAYLAELFEVLIKTYKMIPKRKNEVNNFCTITYMMMQHAKSIPARKRTAFLQWLENDMGVLRNNDVIQAYQDIEDELKLEAALVIQKYWFGCITNPCHPICQRRLAREFAGLIAH
jgi:hypothetical protein